MLETRDDHDISIDDMRGLAKERPLLAMAMTVLLLSLGGIPPTVGFFGKFFLFSAAVKEGLVAGVLGCDRIASSACYYYLRPVVAMYMQESVIEREALDRPMSHFVIVLMALLVVGFGLFSEPFFQLFVQSVAPVF